MWAVLTLTSERRVLYVYMYVCMYYVCMYISVTSFRNSVDRCIQNCLRKTEDVGLFGKVHCV
jgi:hypothetical protein